MQTLQIYLRQLPCLFLSIGLIHLTTGCISSTREEQLQSSNQRTQNQVDKLSTKLENQNNSNAKAILSQQSRIDTLFDRTKLNEGFLDELKMRMSKLEQATTKDYQETLDEFRNKLTNIENNVNKNTEDIKKLELPSWLYQNIISIQKKISYFEMYALQ